VVGVVSLISVSLREDTHTCTEMEGCRKGGAPW
jgi:hypothetical protein